ncbi:MAG: hypothetical protein AAF297_12175 [Planctomycetota bacterium]
MASNRTSLLVLVATLGLVAPSIVVYAVLAPKSAVALPEYLDPPMDIVVPTHSDQDVRNAAVAYGKLMWFPSEAHDAHAFDRLPARNDLQAGWTPTDEFREAFASIEFAPQRFRDATRLAVCDWQPSRELGIYALLPEVKTMHTLLAVYTVSAALHTERGASELALADYSAALRLADHVSQGATLLQARAAADWATTIGERVRTDIDFGSISSAARDEWFEALNRFDRPDPFYFAAAIHNEVEWVIRVSGLEITRAAPEPHGGLVRFTVPDEPVLPQSRADLEELNDILDRARAWKLDAIDAWRSRASQSVEQVRAVDTRAKTGGYGGDLVFALSSLERLKHTELTAIETLSKARP